MEHRSNDRMLGVASTLQADAEKTARRMLEYRFGRLSNRRIVATLRGCADRDEYEHHSDGTLLELWFAAFDDSVRRLKAHGQRPRE